MDRAVSWGMDQGMDRGVWIVCGSGALIHTLYFDSYPYIFRVEIVPISEPPWVHGLQGATLQHRPPVIKMAIDLGYTS